MINVINLSYQQRLKPLSFNVNQGEIIHLVGANGSGKSTLLSLLSGLTQGEGKILFDDLCLKSFRANQIAAVRSYLTQQQKPVFNIRVYQYLCLCMSVHTSTKELCHEIVEIELDKICQQLQLKNKLEKNINELSGGEWQRVRLAGCYLQITPHLNPFGKLALLDEPATGLDIAQQAQLNVMIKSLSQDGITVIMSSHDLSHSLNHADKILLLKKGQSLGFAPPKEIIQGNLLEEVFDISLKSVEINGKVIMLPD